MLRMLAGLTKPSRGEVRLLGQRPRDDVALFRRIGLVPQQENVFENLTGHRFVTLAARLHGMDDPGERAARALQVVELDPADVRPVRAYSKGMRQRVKVAQAIVHEPPILLLDEPLTGLDPRQRLHMVDLFRRLGGEGRCVIVSSHVLEEVERFGSRVLVMAQGRLAAEGDFHAIRELMDDRPHRLRVRTDRPRELASGLVATGAAVGVHVGADGMVLVDTIDAPGFRRLVVSVARDHGARLLELTPLDDDLESVFRYLVQR
jgi:ABC-2 type transport system ATP-binding protein